MNTITEILNEDGYSVRTGHTLLFRRYYVIDNGKYLLVQKTEGAFCWGVWWYSSKEDCLNRSNSIKWKDFPLRMTIEQIFDALEYSLATNLRESPTTSDKSSDQPDWKFFRRNVDGECVCEIPRSKCEFHKDK